MGLEYDLGLSETFPITETEEFPVERKLSWVDRNKEGLLILGIGTIADMVTTCLLLDNSGYSHELNSIPRKVMETIGTANGQLLLKGAFLGAYGLATYLVSPILDRIFKTDSSANKILAYGGYTHLGVAELNLLSLGGINL